MKWSPLRCVALLGLVVGLLTPAEVFASQTIRGTVSDVREQSRRFTLHTEGGGRYEVVYLGPKAGFGVRPPTLFDGDRAEVRGTLVRGVFEAERIVRLGGRGTDLGDREVVVGQIDAVGRNSGILHLMVDRRRWRVDARDADIFDDNGRRIRLRDLREGERVRVMGRDTGRYEVRARRVEVVDGRGGTASLLRWRSGDVGRIDAVGTNSKILHVYYGNARYRVDVGGARIVINNRRRDVRDLREGDRIRVYGRQVSRDTIYADRVEVVW